MTSATAYFSHAAVGFPTETTTDGTRGQPLAARILGRKDELEDAQADLGPHDVIERQAIDVALAAVYGLITGDLAHPSDVVARSLSAWLERHKYVAQGRRSPRQWR